MTASTHGDGSERPAGSIDRVQRRLAPIGDVLGPRNAVPPTVFVATGLFSCAVLPWADRPSRLAALGTTKPIVIGTLLMAANALSMSWSLSAYGDATRINIVYALRGLWAVALAWARDRAGVASAVVGTRDLAQLTGVLATEELELPKAIAAALDDVSA